jgi:hypothetical protein
VTQPPMLVNEIYAGMTVYDKKNRNIGTVVSIHAGDGAPGMARTAAVDRAVATAMERLPADVIDRLLSYGFIKVSTGGFVPMIRLVAFDQVASVKPQDNKLVLAVVESELQKGLVSAIHPIPHC